MDVTYSIAPSLVKKYNVPVPRYTSYPTVPHWKNESFSAEGWKKHVQNAFSAKGKEEGISLYIHLPYCESLCTYCGCNVRITVNHTVELVYIHALLHEWQMYLKLFGERPLIKELHLGGGTPTFFSPENLDLLVTGILNSASVSADAEFGFEGHPNNTTEGHLRRLYALGFRRVSFGIQDFDPKVQSVINRKQTFGQVEYVTDLARLIGYTSINFDLIYGLPLQTLDSVTHTIEKVKRLKPERIAFYSYAHVPWIKPSQRRFTEMDLPDDEAKLMLYEQGRKLLEEIWYGEIGMDHFALPEDHLYKAMQGGSLHRNFMGYTTTQTTMLIGLGCSSISDVGTAYAQNQKVVEHYLKTMEEGNLAVYKGHFLSDEDRLLRKHILNVACRLQTDWKEDLNSLLAMDCFQKLVPLKADGLIQVVDPVLKVTPKGKRFLRNICAVFDVYMLESDKVVPSFSKAI